MLLKEGSYFDVRVWGHMILKNNDVHGSIIYNKHCNIP